MLVELTVTNFRSIKDETTFSMLKVNSLCDTEVSSQTSVSDDTKDDIKNTLNEDRDGVCRLDKFDFDLLKSAIIYGANASGKSTIILALLYFRQFILYSDKINSGQKIPFYEPFCLDEGLLNLQTTFEIEFIIKDTLYNYNVQFDSHKIYRETLCKGSDNNNKYNIFDRTFQQFNFGKSSKLTKYKNEEIQENHLLLTKFAGYNATDFKEVKEIYKYFLNNFKIELPIQTSDLLLESFLALNDNKEQRIQELIKNKILVEKFLKCADTGISGIHFIEKTVGEVSSVEEVGYEPRFLHDKYSNGEKVGVVEFSIHQESKGTARIYELALIVLDCLSNGKILIIDELATNFHPLITKYILSLFNSIEHNKKNAQLIFTTHETSILENSKLSEDQIWFVEKNQYGHSVLFSLAEFDRESLKQAGSLQKWYLAGRFGALPMIDHLEMYEVQ